MKKNIILSVKNIKKSFPGVVALNNINFELSSGEVLGLVGENGAGKSTLVKILSGTYTPDSGYIYFENNLVNISSPIISRKLGFRFIFQELNILDHLTVAENIFIGELPRFRKSFIVNWKKLKNDTIKILKLLKAEINPNMRVGNLPLVEKQIVEIARAIQKKSKILIMDEPTTSLSDKEIELLFNIIKELKEQGVSIIFISHRLDEVLKITDKILILRDGENVFYGETKNINRDILIKYIVGRSLKEMYPKKDLILGDVALNVRKCSHPGGYFYNISFNLRRSEILGFYGLLGSGYFELVRSLFGLLPKKCEGIEIYGEKVEISNTYNAVKNLVGFLPEERKVEGVSLNLDVKTNITMASINKIGKYIFFNHRIEIERAKKRVNDLNIKTFNLNTEVNFLSGGNQQKVALAKWIESSSEILFFNEPTRGVDVGAKVEIYKIMEDLCEQGNSLVIASTDLEEIIGIADRILIFSKGEIKGEFARSEFDKEKILSYATGA